MFADFRLFADHRLLADWDEDRPDVAKVFMVSPWAGVVVEGGVSPYAGVVVSNQGPCPWAGVVVR